MKAVTEIGGQELGPRVRESWLIRYGMWILLAAVATLFAAAAFIPYGSAVTTAPVRFAPAGALAAPAAGRVHLLVREGELVREHQPLATFEADAAAARTAIAVVPVGDAMKVHAGHPATLLLQDGRRLPATIVAVLPPRKEGVPVRVRLDAQPPGLLQGTLSIPVSPSPLITRLLRSPIPR
jgi:hypothetical protein